MLRHPKRVPQPSFCDKRTSHNTQEAEKPNSVGLLTYAYRGGCSSPAKMRSLPGISSSDRFSPCAYPQHLQRRYRPGITPGYLVQQSTPNASSATESVSSCRGYFSTHLTACQQQKIPPRQQKSCAAQHRQNCHRPPRTLKPRKAPACRRYAAPPF